MAAIALLSIGLAISEPYSLFFYEEVVCQERV
jgi:hypothetical protein